MKNKKKLKKSDLSGNKPEKDSKSIVPVKESDQKKENKKEGNEAVTSSLAKFYRSDKEKK